MILGEKGKEQDHFFRKKWKDQERRYANCNMCRSKAITLDKLGDRGKKDVKRCSNIHSSI